MKRVETRISKDPNERSTQRLTRARLLQRSLGGAMLDVKKVAQSLEILVWINKGNTKEC
jgi:hypothetical protein